MELANKKYRSPERTEARPGIQCKALYQEALEGAIELHGEDSEHTGLMRNALGALSTSGWTITSTKARRHSRLRLAFTTACLPGPSFSTNYADLLLKEAKLTEKEIEEIKEELRREREAPPRPL